MINLPAMLILARAGRFVFYTLIVLTMCFGSPFILSSTHIVYFPLSTGISKDFVNYP